MELIGNVRGIRVLCEVAARGSFSSAAQALGITQSAVSQHIAALERQAGLALIQRGTRPAELTQAGAALVRHGRPSAPAWTAPNRNWPRSPAAGLAGSGSAASPRR